MKKQVVKIISLIVLCCLLLCSCEGIDFDFDYQNSNVEDTVDTGSISVHYLDVGQGDSIFIELPTSKTMLIDAGENMYGKSIIDYISLLGYDKIDYLVATHPHSDHIGSMSYIVNHMDIGEVYMPKVATTTKTYEKLLNAISDKGLKIKSALAGVNIFSSDKLNVKIIAPQNINEKNINNSSAVIKITYGKSSFLFMGDAEKDEISDITADLRADVLKVGHHGSKTAITKEFIKSVNPSIAVISVAKNNDYGHPHRITLNYLKSVNARIYRTDKDKTVTVISDGENITVETKGISMKRDMK